MFGITVPISPSTIKVSPKVQLYIPQSLKQELQISQQNLVPLIEGGPTPFGSFVGRSCVPNPPVQLMAPTCHSPDLRSPEPKRVRPALTFLGSCATSERPCCRKVELPLHLVRHQQRAPSAPNAPRSTRKPKKAENSAGIKAKAESLEPPAAPLTGGSCTHRAGIGTLPGSRSPTRAFSGFGGFLGSDGSAPGAVIPP